MKRLVGSLIRDFGVPQGIILLSPPLMRCQWLVVNAVMRCGGGGEARFELPVGRELVMPSNLGMIT